MRRPLLIVLVMLLLLEGCYKDSDFDSSKLSSTDNTVQMYLDLTTIPADSFSVSKVLVELPYNADSTKTLVSFRTDLGFFVESGTQLAQVQAKQNVDSVKRIAIATLRSGTRTGFAHIQVNIFTQTKLLLDTFVNSYPDYLQFTASTLSVKPVNGANGEVSFVCRLFKYTGSPSQLNAVALKVYDSSYSHSYGSFRVYNNLSDPSWMTQFIYVLGDSTVNMVDYTGKLHAVATVAKNAAGGTISSTIDIVSSPNN